MGKIILNNIEYGTGTPNSSNVDTTNLVKKDNIVTVIDENVTDEQIPSAKAVHTVIQNVNVSVPVNTYTKEEIDNLLNDKVNTDDLVDAYSKEEVNNLLDGKADSSAIVDAYTKTEVDDLLANKVNTDDLVDSYSKTETDDLLTAKADATALDGKLDKTSVVTSLSSTDTDAQVPSAKTVYDAIQNVSGGVSTEQLEQAIQEAKTELENEITNIPKVTKTSELTNDSGYITANDIPTTLPASDVYDWAKASTKPTYTASEVGALASNGTATNASRVANELTFQIGGETKNTFNGSSAKIFNIPVASTSGLGVMTKDMVTKLNGIATGATKNTIDTAMSSTSTNAVQNKVIYAYIQEQIKNVVKSAGDYMGKTMISVSTPMVGKADGYTYTNNKGGFADFAFQTQNDRNNKFELIVDGTTIITDGVPSEILKKNTDSTYELKIPFKSTFTVRYYISGVSANLHGFIYVNN